MLLWSLPLWKGGRCREVQIRVNVWPVRLDKIKWQTGGRCGEVPVSGGSFVVHIAHIEIRQRG